MKRLNQTIQTPSFLGLPQEFRTNKAFRLAESGRSMVEMLGVLAIIGVLSVGAVVGYKYATSKHVANTIMSELNLRAVPLSQIRIQNQMAAGTPLNLEIGDKIASGHTISAKVSINPEYFEMTVNGVQQQSCEMILEDYITSSWITVNNTLYENTTSICNAEENDMTFVYSNNLGERRTCSQKGLFNVASYKCECDGGTYFDNGKKDCACPAGHIWSETERKCIESRCQEGEFESLDGGCVPCEDTSSYKIEKEDENAVALCNACPNRYITSHQASQICAYKKCEYGVSFPLENGSCQDCMSEAILYHMSSSEYGQEYCNACPNRFYSSGKCIMNPTCEDGKTFPNYSNECIDCSTNEAVSIGTTEIMPNQIIIDKCLACKNKNGQLNRTTFKNGYYLECIKTICDDNEFMGNNGKCYSCTQENAIPVSNNSGCTNTTCGRIEKEIDNITYCILNKCDTTNYKNVLLSDGSCYPCDTETTFKATQDECDACGVREDGEKVRAIVSGGWCRLNNCTLGKNYPLANGHGSGTLCYSCAGYYDGNGVSGDTEFGIRYCEACGNYVADQRCYKKDSCIRGKEFRANKLYYFCTSCDYTEKVQMANHEEHDKMCADCTTTPRFFADNYCYRCDSNENPVVTTSEERASCTACPNRQINADNQCVLIKTEE